VVGLTIEVRGIRAQIGELCYLVPQGRGEHIPAEVVGFRRDCALVMPLGELDGIQPGTRVVPTHSEFRIPVGEALLGRVLDGLGRPLDGRGPIPSHGLLRRSQRRTASAQAHPHP
jgi:flagellum-specific ATP synthase